MIYLSNKLTYLLGKIYLSDTLIGSFNEAFMKKEISPSQGQDVITLIEKHDNYRIYLENWRSISLTNVGAKNCIQSSALFKFCRELSTAIKLCMLYVFI